MGEVEVGKEREKGWRTEVWDSQRRGWKEQRREKGSPGPPIISWQPPFPPGAQLYTHTHTHTHTPLSGEVGSPLSPFFSFQEGSGSRCCGWDIPWLRTLFPDLS